MKTALLIMAAGIGSRFGGGIKQLEPVGMNGEIIMDYSIHDAIEAGFNKIIFIIRHDIEADFRQIIGNRIEKLCAACHVEVAYAFQELDDLPEGVKLPAGRTKPWGTGQAVLAAKNLIDTPFAVINADDYYGKNAFQALHQYLCEYDADQPYNFCMAGFILKNTLSDHGGVTRGICKVDQSGHLTDVVETSDIVKTIGVDGTIGAKVHGKSIDPNSYVSMNMWGLTPEFVEMLEAGFVQFFRDIQAGKADPMKAEYLLPIYIGQLLREGKVSVQLLETIDKWFGVTYKEDKAVVMDSLKKLIEAGTYQEELFSDLGVVAP